MDKRLKETEATYKAIIKSAGMIYEERLYKLAATLFTETVKPFLVENKYRFYAGMGAWLITDLNGKPVLDVDLPAHIIQFLNQDVVNSNGFQQSIGSMMPDYSPSKQEATK